MDALNVVSLAQAKLWLKIDPDYDEDDSLIESLIKGVVNQVQQYTLQVLYYQVLTAYTGTCGTLKIYEYPLLTIEDVNNDGVFEPFDEYPSDHYTEVRSEAQGNKQLVTYTAGYGWTYDGGTEVPDDILIAIKEYVAYLYENRDDPKMEMPRVVQFLLGPYRRITLF